MAGTITGRLTPNVIHSQDAYFLQNASRSIEEAKDIYTIDYSRLEERCLAIMAQDSERQFARSLFGYPYGMEVIQPQGAQPMRLYTDGFRYVHDAAFWDPKGAIRDLLRTLPKRKRRRVRGRIKAALRASRQ